MEQALSRVAAVPVTVLFAPHLVPMDRGIHSTIYTDADTDPWTTRHYGASTGATTPTLRSCASGTATRRPRTRRTRTSSTCPSERSAARSSVLAAEDNLVRGASGVAVQNMNLLFRSPGDGRAVVTWAQWVTLSPRPAPSAPAERAEPFLRRDLRRPGGRPAAAGVRGLAGRTRPAGLGPPSSAPGCERHALPADSPRAAELDAAIAPLLARLPHAGADRGFSPFAAIELPANDFRDADAFRRRALALFPALVRRPGHCG